MAKPVRLPLENEITGDVLDEALRGPIHFMGVGGYGMSGLALMLASHGVEVSGCDVRKTSLVSTLISRGIPVYLGHDPDHLRGVSALVLSTDIPDDNPEVRAARDSGLTLLHRSHLLGRLFEAYSESIAIGGTHGKTSTSAMMFEVLMNGGADPSAVIGGELTSLGFTARVGESEYFVAEACESDGSFLRYNPQHIIVTNLEPEHLEFYDGSFARQKRAFRQFLHNVRDGGKVVVNCDDEALFSMTENMGDGVVRCSLRAEYGDYRAENKKLNGDSSSYTLVRRGEDLGRIELPVAGEHMISNSLQAAALALELEVPLFAVRRGLAGYSGVKRRFQKVGRFGGALVVDDYAHHPTEIRVTLRSARRLASGRVVAAFQPQRYTRTHLLMDEFSRSFESADVVILTPIYSPPGQKPIPGVTSEKLAQLIRQRSGKTVYLADGSQEVVERMVELAEEGGVLITMGAGNIWKAARDLAVRSREVAAPASTSPPSKA